MRPQQEKKHFGIFGNRNNKTNKDDYRIKERNPFALIAQVSFSLRALLCHKKKKNLLKINNVSVYLNPAKQISILISTSESFPELPGFYLTF